MHTFILHLNIKSLADTDISDIVHTNASVEARVIGRGITQV